MSGILFIRHAETDMAGTFCGHSDPELNARGRSQLCDLTTRLKNENIGAIYTSDLLRAHSTAAAVAEFFGIDCQTRSALREIEFGQWEGLTWKEIEARDPIYARNWIAQYPHLPAPGGEKFSDFVQRITRALEIISAERRDSNQRTAVVTHAGVINTILRTQQGLSLDEASERTKSYCSIVRHDYLNLSTAQPIEVIP